MGFLSGLSEAKSLLHVNFKTVLSQYFLPNLTLTYLSNLVSNSPSIRISSSRETVPWTCRMHSRFHTSTQAIPVKWNAIPLLHLSECYQFIKIMPSPLRPTWHSSSPSSASLLTGHTWHLLYCSLYHQNWKPAKYISQTPLLASFQVRFCRRLDCWKRDATLFFLLLAYLQQLSATAEDCRQLHTPQALAALVEHSLQVPAELWQLNCGSQRICECRRLDSAPRQLSDLWLGTPCSLVLLHT